MTLNSPRNRMIAKLHVLKKEHGLDDGAYRDKLELATGHRSATACDDAQLEKALVAFHVKQNQNNSYTRKLIALWVSAFNLGAIESGTDDALAAFITRQTGKENIKFLTPAEANKVTEALKDICGRAGFIVPASGKDGREPREALLKAQWALLHGMGKVNNPHDDAMGEYVCRRYRGCHGGTFCMSTEQLDQSIKGLGRWIRGARRAKAASA